MQHTPYIKQTYCNREVIYRISITYNNGCCSTCRWASGLSRPSCCESQIHRHIVHVSDTFAAPRIPLAARSANKVEAFLEDTCCRCLRRGWEHDPDACEAEFDKDGNMLAKCEHCSDLHAECIAVGVPILFAIRSWAEALAKHLPRFLETRLLGSRPTVRFVFASDTTVACVVCGTSTIHITSL